MTEATKEEIRQLGIAMRPALPYIETSMKHCFQAIVDISNSSIQSGTNLLTQKEGIKTVAMISDMASMRGISPEDMMAEDIPSFMDELSQIQPMALEIGNCIATNRHLNISTVMEFIRLAARMMNFIKIMKEVEE